MLKNAYKLGKFPVFSSKWDNFRDWLTNILNMCFKGKDTFVNFSDIFLKVDNCEFLFSFLYT